MKTPVWSWERVSLCSSFSELQEKCLGWREGRSSGEQAVRAFTATAAAVVRLIAVALAEEIAAIVSPAASADVV